MWLEVKQDAEQLAHSLASYDDILLAKRARMGDIHSLTEVVRQMSKNLTVMCYSHFSLLLSVKPSKSLATMPLWKASSK